MRTLLFAAAFMLAPIAASAAGACIQMGSSTNDAFQYLMCLHNNMVDTTNALIEAGKGTDNDISKLDRQMRRLEAENAALRQEVEALKARTP